MIYRQLLRAICFFVGCLVSQQGNAAESLSMQWQNLKASWTGGEIRIGCGANNYKLTKSFGGSYHLFWLDEKANWFPLTIEQPTDEAISFSGFGRASSEIANTVFQTGAYKEDAEAEVNKKILQATGSPPKIWHYWKIKDIKTSTQKTSIKTTIYFSEERVRLFTSEALMATPSYKRDEEATIIVLSTYEIPPSWEVSSYGCDAK